MSDTTGATPPAASPNSGRSLPRGGGRGNPNTGRGGGNNNRSINRYSKFEGDCTDLKGSILDCSGYVQADVFAKTKIQLTSHVGRTYYTHGGVISKAMKSFVSPTVTMPIAPEDYGTDKCSPSDKYMYELKLKKK